MNIIYFTRNFHPPKSDICISTNVDSSDYEKLKDTVEVDTVKVAVFFGAQTNA